jgi:hypothetical protein
MLSWKPVRRHECHVREAAGESADLECLREPRIPRGHDHGQPVLACDLDDRIDTAVGDAKRLLPGMQEEATEPELLDRPLELGARVIAEQRIDACDSRQPSAGAGNRLGDGIVRGGEVITGGLGRTDDRLADPELVHDPHELARARTAPEDRLTNECQAVDDQRTPSRMRTAFPAKTSASASGASPASRTFSTSIRGEHAGPSLA